MKKIKDVIESTIIIDKSKFITLLYPVESMEEIENVLSATRKKYYDATHNCYAYIFDNGRIQKCSDDGEPSKTAGFPMLDVLKKNDLTDVLAITTRYFGGIKLGAGGLIRAYSSSVSTALKDVTFFETKKQAIYQIEIDYSDYSRNIDYWNTLNIISSKFEANVILEIAFFEDDINPSIEKIKNLTQGKAQICFIDHRLVDIICD
jgi:uncharacterized YigZ family protein